MCFSGYSFSYQHVVLYTTTRSTLIIWLQRELSNPSVIIRSKRHFEVWQNSCSMWNPNKASTCYVGQLNCFRLKFGVHKRILMIITSEWNLMKWISIHILHFILSDLQFDGLLLKCRMSIFSEIPKKIHKGWINCSTKIKANFLISVCIRRFLVADKI